ncbi:hypothetical protein SUDANB6_00922 [Streptomyces sp. enrichment culture]|uniref:hypothetical protein n=1 Tax=Streptomyces sp. enrichment culture TaxID=1795815 RepID=UPI003F5735EE
MADIGQQLIEKELAAVEARVLQWIAQARARRERERRQRAEFAASRAVGVRYVTCGKPCTGKRTRSRSCDGR